VKARDIPNLISIFRIILVLPVVLFLLQKDFKTALVLFAIAGVSDAIDGYLARRFNWMTRLGGILDPLADKLLQVCSYITLAWLGMIPAWLVVAVVLRDLVIVTGGVVYHYKFEHFKAEPSIISKVNTFMQIALVLVVVLHEGFYALPDPLLQVMIYGVLFTTVTSGLGYVYKWGQRAIQIHRDRQQS
jgi:cardiolipin synthase